MSDTIWENPALIRKIEMQIMRTGFCIHPDRPFLFCQLPPETATALWAEIEELAVRYFDLDIVLLGADFETNEDNLYLLSDCSEEAIAYLTHKALLVIGGAEPSEKNILFLEGWQLQIAQYLDDAGFVRGEKGLLAIDENETTKILSK